MLESRTLQSAQTIALILLVIGWNGACSRRTQDRVNTIQTAQSQGQERTDAIAEAFRYLPQLIRMDRTTALQEIRYQLNTWSKSVEQPPGWTPSSLLESIPGGLRAMDFSQRMSKLEFGEPECEFLLQCQMMNQINQWVLDRPYRDPQFAPWLMEQKGKLSDTDWNQLQTVLKVWDWSMCNVAVDGSPKEVEKLQVNPDANQGDAGPIYRQLPWQTIMFARGDAWQRARAFTQLLFAEEIDAMVLALPSITGAVEDAALRLWCVGVPIGDEIYLFEPRWGLPIPSQSSRGVATLREAKADPNVLRRAKLPGRFEYPVQASDLSAIIALADVEPFTVGRTMYTLEQSLTGANRHRLSFDADRFEERVHKIDPSVSVRLWNVPWMAHVYNLSVRGRLGDMSPFSLAYIDQHGIFITDTPISRARMMHFKGQFDSKVDAVGALRTYMDFRVDERTLKNLEFDRDTQKMLGVVRRENEKLENFVMRIQQAQSFYRKSKFDIGVFLGMVNLDLEKPDTAADWLSKRTLEVRGTEKWHAQAHYLLGRIYEGQGKTAEAIEEYKYEDSPQAAGNRIRIRRLEALNPTPPAEKKQ